MAQSLSLSIPDNLGTNAGAASDGVLIGQLTATDPDTVLLKTLASNSGLCITDDGGAYVQDSTDFNDAGADDVAPLPATPAVDDACYFGHATIPFAQLDLNETTQGAGTWTITWEYWDGSAWTALSGVTDGTTGFTAATGTVSVTFTQPTDWETCLVDGVLAYWVRARVSAYTSITTQPLIGQGWVFVTGGEWTDDTTDFTDAGAGDVKLLPDNPQVGDGLYIGYSEQFCKIKVTTSQARTGTATIALKYWDGTTWSAVTTVDDDSTGYSATAGTHYIHFIPPSDWVANTTANGPNSTAGFFVVMELTVLTDVTQQPLGTQGWVLPLKTGASGIDAPKAFVNPKLTMAAQTASATNADTTLLLVNTTKGTSAAFTWTKADPLVEATGSLTTSLSDGLALVQVTEDGTTEFADASITLEI